MANADEYRDWAAQQNDTRTRDAMYAEADRIDRRDRAERSPHVTRITINIRTGEQR